MKLILVLINRVNDVKTGTLIGVDKYGNKYYEDKKNYFFGESRRCFYVRAIFVAHFWTFWCHSYLLADNN